MFQVGDFFIGEYPVVEYFGSNPAIYSARYNIQGYPGMRVKMPSLTPILAAADGFVLETGFEEAGKGKYITLVHSGFLTTYGHLNDIQVKKDERVVSGQLIAHSNQSGLAEFPCLYFGIAPCDLAGNLTENNEYGGYIDPLGNEVKWDVKNLVEPVTKSDVISDMKLTSTEYSNLTAQAANYRITVNFLKKTSFDEYLKENNRIPINLELTPDDSTGGESIALYLSSIADEFEEMNKTIDEQKEEIAKLQLAEEIRKSVPQKATKDPSVKKPNYLIRSFNATWNFIFSSKR